jgi:hypothetical protein
VSIAILTPSRGRPGQLASMINEAYVTAEDSTAFEVYYAIDEDDAETYQYVDEIVAHAPTTKIIGERQQLAGWTNTLAEIALADGHDILASWGDDHRPRTYGWDTSVTTAMDRMGPGLVYTADGLQNERLPTAPFWHRSIIEAWGFYFFPSCVHLYADDYWLYAAKALGRCAYLPDVMIEHLHPSSGKAKPDAINAENDAHYAKDGQAYALWLSSPEHRASLDRARAVL